MNRLIRLLALLTAVVGSGVLAGSPARAGSPSGVVTGVECELEIFAVDQTSDQKKLLFSDTIQFVNGLRTTGFLVSFSTDIEFVRVDSSGVTFNVHTVTLGPQVSTNARTFSVEYGLPATLQPIIGKNDSRFALVVTPMAMIDIDTSFCSYNHAQKGLFKLSPTAHMDLYYVPGTFGEYYWTLARGVLEENYERMQQIFNFNLPGKYNIYLAPCALHSIIWDKRFGTAVDPTRSSAYAIYNGGFSTLDPFISSHTIMLRNFGYAPIFLSEGLANFLSFAVFDMKGIVLDGSNLPLRGLLDSYNYYEADPIIAERTSACFVRYLIRTYDFDRFRDLYKEADDLSLASKIESTYGLEIEQLEERWLHYIDTLQFSFDRLLLHTNLSEALFNFPMMLKYARVLTSVVDTPTDSVRSLELLKQAYFFNGDYFNAIETQKKLLQLRNDPTAWTSLGIYNMMNGFYDNALSDLLTARSLDSNNALIDFNLALSHRLRGDSAAAIKLLTEIVDRDRPGTAQGESRILLGEMLKASKNKEDRALAITYFKQAQTIFQNASQARPSSPIFRMWIGISWLGLGDTESAYDYLQTALFLETRPFYLGMINLWLGKLADLLDSRETARDYYSLVISSPSAAYHRDEARQYLQSPYRD